jgi:uncharacterized membrane protein YhaH (DUF805 family)
MQAGEIARALLTFQGRTGRGMFWATAAGCAIVSGLGERLGGLVGGLVGLLVLWVFLAAVTRRAHDRGRSFWAVAVAAVPFVIGVMWFLIVPGLMAGLALGPLGAILGGGLGWLVFAAWWVIGGIWLLWELGIQGGTPGPNLYGPRPADLLDPPASGP